jgi:hypothetical protein
MATAVRQVLLMDTLGVTATPLENTVRLSRTD